MKTARNAQPEAKSSPAHGIRDVTDLFGFHIFRLSNSLGRLAEAGAQRQTGLTLPEYRCLSVIARYQEMTVTGLCSAIQIDKAWVSRTLSRLEEKGLVHALSDPSDARKSLYKVTSAGKKVSQKLLGEAYARQATYFKGFTDAEKIALRDLLARVQGNVDRLLDN